MSTPTPRWIAVVQAFLFGLIRRPKTWLIVTLLALAGLAAHAAWDGSKGRGLTQETIWLAQAVDQRTEYYRGALKGAPEASDKDVIHKTFAPHSALPPLLPAIAATVKGERDVGAVTTLRTINAFAFGALVFLVGLMALRASGPFGALAAAFGTMTLPRLFGLGASAGFGITGVLAFTLTVYLLHRARYSVLATLGALLSVAATVHLGVIGLMAWFPWLYCTVTRAGLSPSGDGYTASPSVPLRVALMVPAGLALGFILYPWIWNAPKDNTIQWLSHFLRDMKPVFSYGGEIWGQRRIPWHAAPYLLLVTVPPPLLFLAVAGYRGGELYERLSQVRGLRWLRHLPMRPATRETLPAVIDPCGTRFVVRRLALVALSVTLTFPLLFRTPYFSGFDLIAFALPWFLVLVGVGAERIVRVVMDSVDWRRILRASARGSRRVKAIHAASVAVLFALITVPTSLDLARYHPLEEAYYSWLIGGPEGARARGLPRYPNGPLPADLIDDAVAKVDRDRVSVGFILPGAHKQELSWAVGQGVVDRRVVVAPSVYSADIAILPHDDLDPGYEDAATSFYRTVSSNEDGYEVVVYQRGDVPIFSAAVVSGQ